MLVIVAGNSSRLGLWVVIPISIEPDHLSMSRSIRIYTHTLQMYPIYPMSHVYKKLGLLGYSRTTSPKYISYPWFLAEMTIIHLPTDSKIWYRLRTTYMVPTETIAPLQDNMPLLAECAWYKQWNSCVRNIWLYFTRNMAT